MKLPSLNNVKIAGRKILVRVDWNVPLDLSNKSQPRILDDRRIRANFATLNELLSRHAGQIIILTHLGRPDGRRVEFLSTGLLKQHFSRIYPFYQEEKFEILENVRFNHGEKENSLILAKKYAALADVFVNDAFSVSHRNHMSVVALAELLPHVAGLEMLTEVTNLTKVRDHPSHPFVVIIGGAKIHDKKPAVIKFSQLADKVLVGGKTSLEAFKDNEIRLLKNIVLPVDYRLNSKGEKWDIGDKTVQIFQQELKSAKMVFWNGNLGKSEELGFEKGSVAIAKFLASLRSQVVVAGGDTVELIDNLKLREKYTYISMGGGASLKFLAGEKLPGLEVLKK